MTSVTAHMLVRNDERWVWFAIMSVIDRVDTFMIWDTGSTDKTVEIIKSINNPKIKFKSAPVNSKADLSVRRQEMLDQTKTDWLFLVDGDEVWTEVALDESFSNLNKKYRYIVSSYKNLLGDVYHYQEERAGRYKIGPFKGHVTIRFYNLTMDKLHYQGEYPLEGFYTGSGHKVQDRYDNEPFINQPYLHFTHLRESDKSIFNRSNYKYELGIPFTEDFTYPKVFFLSPPSIVSNPWMRRSMLYILNSFWQTPLKYLRRRMST